MSEKVAAMSGHRCAGYSSINYSAGDRRCPAPPLYRIKVGALTRWACGRHVSYVLGVLLPLAGRSAEVTREARA